ncbi:MAG TPA: cation:proton antiporter [Candidatus Nanoarchaeia archaeon]|nr:cation:proton antiporter [Candidatus Nanoarchaeia archaeon]
MATELVSLGILFLCAVVGGIIATRFKQPAVFGLLLVGAIVGPHSLKLVENVNMITAMAEIGAILMLFTIGMEFDISKLLRLGARSVLIGLLKFAIVLFFGYQATLLMGFSVKVALFIGVILSFSSTVVIVKVLEQKEMFSRKEVPLLIAVLIIEDILAVFTLTFFSGVKDSTAGILPIFEKIIFSVAILIFAYIIMMKVLKYIIITVRKNSNDESVLVLLSLALGALFSWFALFLGLTPSAGAFLAGSLIASLPNAKEYGKAVKPLALIFTSIFFISMGTLVDFATVKYYLPLIGVLLLTVIVSRFVAVGFVTMLLANFKDDQPLFSSIAMISVGEFSLLVAKEGQKFGLGIDLVTITAAIIFTTAIIMSIGINHSEKIHSSFNARVSSRGKLRLEKLSGYMRRFFDQTEIENFFTNKLKSESKLALMLGIVLLFAFLIFRQFSLLIKSGLAPIFLYVFYGLSLIIFGYLLNLLYKRLKEIHHVLAVILTNVDSSKNLAKCYRILNNLLIALVLFFSAMLFPFAMFTFNLSVWMNLVPFVLAGMSFYYFKRLLMYVEGHSISVPSYKAGLATAKF